MNEPPDSSTVTLVYSRAKTHHSPAVKSRTVTFTGQTPAKQLAVFLYQQQPVTVEAVRLG